LTVQIIVNPAAGQGACGRNWPAAEAKLRKAFPQARIAFTETPGQERALSRAAMADGATHFIAVGGDGTVNGVLNGMLGEDGRVANPSAVLSPVPAGTANELARELGFHGDVDGAVRAAAGRRRLDLDLLHAECAGFDGGQVSHGAFLAVSWGAAAEISYRTSTSRYMKKLGGRFSYYAVTLIVTLTYPTREMALTIDDAPAQSLLQYTGMICNTEVTGGGMKLAPGADTRDGIADLLLFRDIPRKDILLQKPSWLFEGHHVEHEKIDLIQGRRFAVEGPADCLVDADGETIGRLPLKTEVWAGGCPVYGLPG
jgi:diacylglycerol kinase (ATP)